MAYYKSKSLQTRNFILEGVCKKIGKRNIKWREVELESSFWLMKSPCLPMGKKYKSGKKKKKKLTLNLVNTHDRLSLVLIEKLVSKKRMVI